MTELFNSWPWYDRAILGLAFGAVVAFGTLVARRLDRIIELLERERR